jgi:hypothetical protein
VIFCLAKSGAPVFTETACCNSMVVNGLLVQTIHERTRRARFGNHPSALESFPWPHHKLSHKHLIPSEDLLESASHHCKIFFLAESLSVASLVETLAVVNKVMLYMAIGHVFRQRFLPCFHFTHQIRLFTNKR